MLKKWSTLLVAMSAISAYADMTMAQMEKEIVATTAADTRGAKLPVGWGPEKGMGGYVSFDVLYWHPKVDSTSYAYSSSRAISANAQVVANGAGIDGAVKDIPFEWNWGFRAGVGVDMRHDSWKLDAEYTYFSEGTSSSLSAGMNGYVIPLTGDIAPSLGVASLTGVAYVGTSASSSFKLNYQTVDVALRRSYFISEELLLEPAIGLEGAWLTLDQHSQYTGGTVNPGVFGNQSSLTSFGANTLHVSNNSKVNGLGPLAAFNSKWNMSNGFSILGGANFAYLFGHYTISHNSYYTGLLNNPINLSSGIHRLTPHAGFKLGLSYDTHFKEKANHLNISLSYETQYWWNVYRATQVFGYNSIASDIPGDLSLYGVTLHVLWEF